MGPFNEQIPKLNILQSSTNTCEINNQILMSVEKMKNSNDQKEIYSQSFTSQEKQIQLKIDKILNKNRQK